MPVDGATLKVSLKCFKSENMNTILTLTLGFIDSHYENGLAWNGIEIAPACGMLMAMMCAKANVRRMGARCLESLHSLGLFGNFS